MPTQAKKGKEPAVDDLERFVWAQEGGELGTFKTGLAEIASGAKVTCWIWYVLPQIEDPGRRSANNTRYGLHAKAEITDYLRHPVLAARYVSIWDAALAVLRKAHKKCQNPSSKFGTLLKLFGGNVDTRKAYHSLSTMALGSLSMGKPSRAPADVPSKQEEGAHEEAPPPYLWEPTTWQAYFANALSVFVVEYLDGVMATCEAAGRKHNFERCLRLKRNIKPPRRTSNDKADTTTANGDVRDTHGDGEAVAESEVPQDIGDSFRTVLQASGMNAPTHLSTDASTIIDLVDPLIVQLWCALP